MKSKTISLLSGLVVIFLLSGCGQLSQFASAPSDLMLFPDNIVIASSAKV